MLVFNNKLEYVIRRIS